MPVPSKDDQKLIIKKLAQTLWGTPFECVRLAQLGGGSVNFIFRGQLKTPVSRSCDGEEVTDTTVIVKHAAEYLSCNKDFELDPSRWDAEVSMLKALMKFDPSSGANKIMVRTPTSYLSDSETRIQVMQDVRDGFDLRSKLTSQIPSVFQAPYISSLGFAVGNWLWQFHDWMADPERDDLRQIVRENRLMREHKGVVTYGVLVSALKDFPDLLESYGTVLSYAMAEAASEFQRPQHDGLNWGVIHGDLWAGNILISACHETNTTTPVLYVIDWEMVQYGHRAYDLGQMIGDLLEARHFKNSHCATWAMEGFIKGYGPISDELAFRTAIHAGAHLIAWGTRRKPDGSLSAPLDQATALMQMAIDFIVKGRRKERNWFLSSPIACLFT